MPATAKANNTARWCLARCLGAVAVLCLLVALPAAATEYNSKNRDNPTNKSNPWTEDIRKDVGIIEKLNSPVPLELTLIDEQGDPVGLGTFFKEGRPVVINLGYSRCPSICVQMRGELTRVMPKIDKTLGEDFIVLNISIDPNETPEISRRMRSQVFEELEDQGVEVSEAGWRFLTADQDTIVKLTEALGYRYMYIKPQDEYGHPGVLVMADGKGTIRRYFSGTAYSAKAFEMSIVETSDGKVGSMLERAFVTCFTWDPDANNYAATAKFIMMIGGAVMLVLAIGLVCAGFAYEKRRRQIGSDDSNTPGPGRTSGQPGTASGTI